MAATDAQHAELVEKIQQLNLLRERNATIRADSEAHAKRSRDPDTKLKSVLPTKLLFVSGHVHRLN